jgi:crotonobetaine/carnitine-CoA ligase
MNTAPPAVEQVKHGNIGEIWSVAKARHLIEHIVAGCKRNPDLPLVVMEDGPQIGRAEFLQQLAQFGGYLKPHIKPGDRVGLCLGNRIEFFIALFAAIACRAVVVAINPDSKDHDAGYMLQDAQPSVLIVQPDNRALFERLSKELKHKPIIVALGEGAEPRGFAHLGSKETSLDLEHSDCRPEDITCVFYTSGTTGAPKGCMVDHRWWIRIVDVDLRLNPEGRERALCCVPFFYADPAIYLMELLQIGGTLVSMRRFSVSRYWDVVHRFGITKVHAIASIPVLLVKAPPHPHERDHKVHHATCVAVPPNFHRQLVERFGFPWIDNYGATETGQICRMPWHMRDEMIGLGSLGVPSPEVELRIVDDEGRDVGVGESGESLVRAPHMFSGYFNRPDATAEALRDGWYHTGDLVKRDERGFVYFLGRKKDIIRRSGQNVAAAEVETVLRLLPEVKDAAVIPVPDEIRGEEVKAYLLLVDGKTPQDLPPEEVVRFCTERLGGFKVPRYIEYRSGDFPRTPSMRVQKQELKAEKSDLTLGAWDRDKEMGRVRS